jgi:(R,R)-butanediol dehydrogenase / meso-butanediol dehydrogenase / diacetyl reductase
MRALRFHAARDLRLDEVSAPPAPSAGQVLIAPVVCGICGTDVHEYVEGPMRTTVEPHPVTGAAIPQILGHELSATVVEVGSDVSSVAPGDRVSVMPLVSCGMCALCRGGQEQLCDGRASVGLRHPWGGMAELALVNENQVVPMPDAMSWEQGALIEPAAVSWAAIQAGGVSPGHLVLVTGAGPIGALAALAGAAAGASVVVSEPDPARARHVASLGFDVLDPREVDVAQACRERSPSGVDVAIECSGQEAALQAALGALRPGGRAVQAGLPTRPVTLDIAALMLRGLSLVGSVGYPLRSWPALITEVVSGRLPVERVVTGRVALEQAVRDGFEPLVNPHDGAVKVLVELGAHAAS